MFSIVDLIKDISLMSRREMIPAGLKAGFEDFVKVSAGAAFLKILLSPSVANANPNWVIINNPMPDKTWLTGMSPDNYNGMESHRWHYSVDVPDANDTLYFANDNQNPDIQLTLEDLTGPGSITRDVEAKYTSSTAPTQVSFNLYVDNQPVSVRENEISPVANNYRLEQNYPNPFNPSTTVKYEIPTAAKVKFRVLNLLGQEIDGFEKQESAGVKEIVWNGKDKNGNDAPSGMYIYQLIVGDGVPQYNQAKKMMLVR